MQVKGKTSVTLRTVDKTAKAARESPTKIDRGFQVGTVSRSMIKGAAKRYPATGQIALIRPYRKNLMRRGEEKIRFDSISTDGKAYVASFYAYATVSVAAELHRQHAYRVQFDDNTNYPKILECLEEVPLPTPSRPATTGAMPS